MCVSCVPASLRAYTTDRWVPRAGYSPNAGMSCVTTGRAHNASPGGLLPHRAPVSLASGACVSVTARESSMRISRHRQVGSRRQLRPPNGIAVQPSALFARHPAKCSRNQTSSRSINGALGSPRPSSISPKHNRTVGCGDRAGS
jgi:hypothetical protein